MSEFERAGINGLFVAAVLLAGCTGVALDSGSPQAGAAGSTASGGAAGTTGAAGVSGTASAASPGVPCDIAQYFASNCLLCHGATPLASVPMSLVSYADLTAPAKSDPTKSVLELSIERMSNATMPPGGGATATQINLLQSWLGSGMPMQDCGDAGVVVPPDPYNTPVVCTSGQTVVLREGATMDPGQACISCHRTSGEAPIFVAGGTLYPTAHEPNNCSGGSAVSGAEVVLTGANGQTVSMTVNASGNFYTSARSLSLPYTAQVLFQGRVRAMATPQTEGDCNLCHTETGANNAPGRIMLP